jgi:hypothetical protein
VIVPIIDQDCVLVFKTECHPPIAVDFDCPVACKFAVQGVQIPTRHVHSAGACCAVQCGQLVLQLIGMCWIDASFRSVQEEFFKPGMPERLDHTTTVSLSDTVVNLLHSPSRATLAGYPGKGSDKRMTAEAS